MSHQAGYSNVGSTKVYESDDQRKYGPSEIAATGAKHGVNTAGYKDQTGIMNELYSGDIGGRIKDRYKHEPGYAATMHGNKPSRGADVDARIQQEEEEMLEKKNAKIDSLPGKKNREGTLKSGLEAEFAAESRESWTEHSKRGANTGKN
ncbi:hypothetical protein NKR23_g3680 [Pleurostoma richardsiae]|uniref:Uncharacterized protein n=1 Tax=Pleurostoma richardsiae TaxID=41990 RepID=A0AA38RIL6_9PEZI|nr:hypothetical protein NKR23_g3680 [Pleurostoma richardsiae]